MKIQTAAGKTFAIIINSLYIAYARKLIDVATKIKSTVVLIEQVRKKWTIEKNSLLW